MARRLSLSVLGLLPLASFGAAEHKIVGVSLFKNGYAVITRTSDVSGTAETEIEAPEAVLGTFWFGTSAGTTLTEARVFTRTVETNVPFGSLDAILSANVGKVVTIETGQSRPNQVTEIKGTIKAVQGTVLVLTLERGEDVVLHKDAVIRIVSGSELQYSAKSPSPRRVLTVGTRGTGKVFTLALQRGMTWSPAYQVDISAETKLQLRSRAVILNDLGDYTNVDVRLITGFPSVKFFGSLDPFTAAVYGAIYAGVAPGSAMGGGGSADALMNQAAGRVAGEEVTFGNFSPGGTGQQLEDMFYYTLPGVSLKSGERLYRPLFQSEADYKHLYRIDLQDRSARYMGGFGQPGGGNDPSLETRHVIEFRNTSGQPLTTAPAMLMKAGEVIGQDQINYTATGGTVELFVGKALDIQSEEVEEQLERERGVIKDRHGNDRMDRITIKSTVTILNQKDKAVHARVTKRTIGELVSADNGGKSKTTPSVMGSENPGLNVEWEFDLKAGERRVVTYTYTILVPPIG